MKDMRLRLQSRALAMEMGILLRELAGWDMVLAQLQGQMLTVSSQQTGAEVHLCLLCVLEASGKAPHSWLVESSTVSSIEYA